VHRIEHLPPARHTWFYGRQRYTLNVTRADMRRAGWSPSVRLFEAAACGAPIISDRWPGLDEVLTPDEHVLIANEADDVVAWLEHQSEAERLRIARGARERVLEAHSGLKRADELLRLLDGAQSDGPRVRVVASG
jgi:spore maturation protein CgeB